MPVNEDLVRRTYARIKADVDRWDQNHFMEVGAQPCKTSFCFAGHALVEHLGWERFIEEYLVVEDDEVVDGKGDIEFAAQQVLGLDADQAFAIFFSNYENDLDEMRATIEDVTGVVLDV